MRLREVDGDSVTDIKLHVVNVDHDSFLKRQRPKPQKHNQGLKPAIDELLAGAQVLNQQSEIGGATVGKPSTTGLSGSESARLPGRGVRLAGI